MHSEMIHWMIQLLIQLAANPSGVSEEAKQLIYASTRPVDRLKEIGESLMDKLTNLTKVLISYVFRKFIRDKNLSLLCLCRSCSTIESETNNTKEQDTGTPIDPEKEGKTLKNLKVSES
jgi:hypothetical protein